jgi:hypothetical protein
MQIGNRQQWMRALFFALIVSYRARSAHAGSVEALFSLCVFATVYPLALWLTRDPHKMSGLFDRMQGREMQAILATVIACLVLEGVAYPALWARWCAEAPPELEAAADGTECDPALYAARSVTMALLLDMMSGRSLVWLAFWLISVMYE